MHDNTDKTEKQAICREEIRKETIYKNTKKQRCINNKNNINTKEIIIKTIQNKTKQKSSQ